MSTWTVLGFLAIVGVFCYAPEIARKVARLVLPQDRCARRTRRRVRLRVRGDGAQSPNRLPSTPSDWIALGMRGATKWK